MSVFSIRGGASGQPCGDCRTARPFRAAGGPMEEQPPPLPTTPPALQILHPDCSTQQHRCEYWSPAKENAAPHFLLQMLLPLSHKHSNHKLSDNITSYGLGSGVASAYRKVQRTVNKLTKYSSYRHSRIAITSGSWFSFFWKKGFWEKKMWCHIGEVCWSCPGLW